MYFNVFFPSRTLTLIEKSWNVSHIQCTLTVDFGGEASLRSNDKSPIWLSVHQLGVYCIQFNKIFMQMSIFRLSNRITSRAGFMSTPGGGIDYVSFQMFFHRSLIILLKVMLLHCKISISK